MLVYTYAGYDLMESKISKSKANVIHKMFTLVTDLKNRALVFLQY